MKELKEYLAPELLVVQIGEYIFTDSSEQDHTPDIYDESSSNPWWN